MGTIDEDAIQSLSFVANLSKMIKSKSDQADLSGNVESFFPAFLWVVRDFSLDLVDDVCVVAFALYGSTEAPLRLPMPQDGQAISAETYMEKNLEPRGPQPSIYNLFGSIMTFL